VAGDGDGDGGEDGAHWQDILHPIHTPVKVSGTTFCRLAIIIKFHCI